MQHRTLCSTIVPRDTQTQCLLLEEHRLGERHTLDAGLPVLDDLLKGMLSPGTVQGVSARAEGCTETHCNYRKGLEWNNHSSGSATKINKDHFISFQTFMQTHGLQHMDCNIGWAFDAPKYELLGYYR